MVPRPQAWNLNPDHRQRRRRQRRGDFLNWENPTERYNMPDTLKAQHTAHLTRGHVLYSDFGASSVRSHPTHSAGMTAERVLECSARETKYGVRDTRSTGTLASERIRRLRHRTRQVRSSPRDMAAPVTSSAKLSLTTKEHAVPAAVSQNAEIMSSFGPR